ncbi:NAD(P)-dependent alcohol dehydrogenase [Saccharopolyspora sp. NFXS83]|uniref:NAD(P)-dependent alcohol dehydrogenase n=1 Tax=Saccharopolyspora sp. NFXS83 TaxID=2993560 RepID=UPI00224AEC49|nr:NAD(P)-dependent alcohol dehydrogenase [Saccharopolyspora sp. NFXS83]MCX2732732.1 NAD(P)-dependent alcohol dehydrogenase [Saccharopolyspora sp. NFXS83]
MQITAAVVPEPGGEFVLERVELDDPREDEVLVRVTAAGLCHTDLAAKDDPRRREPIVLGHEGTGVVERVGAAVTRIEPGDRVALSYRSCGRCRPCRAGDRPYCEQARRLNSAGRRPDGSPTLTWRGEPVAGSFFGQSCFATHALATADNAVVIGDQADPLVAAPMGCGFQTGAGAVLNVLRPGAESSLVIFGAGGVGLAALLAARSAGVRTIIAVDVQPRRRELALRLGASDALDPARTDVVATIAELTGGGATHALEATGLAAVLTQAVAALGATGVAAVVGLGAAEAPLNLRDLLYRGKTVRGCIEGDAVPQRFIPELLELHAAGRFPVRELVAEYRFADINSAVADQRGGEAVKPVLVW